MEHEKEKLDRFIDAVNMVTDNQVREILDEAKRESDSIKSAAEAAAEEAKKRHLDDNIKMTSAKYTRLVSKAEFETKKEMLMCREELTSRLFDEISEKLREYTRTDEYEKRMKAAIGGESELSDAVIYLSPADMRLVPGLSVAADGEPDFAADDNIKYGGYCVLRKSRGTVTDRTFDSALKEQHTMFSSKNLFSQREDKR